MAKRSHALAGVAGTIGARRLHVVARELELLAEREHDGEAQARLLDLEGELAALDDLIEAALERETETIPEPPDDARQLLSAVARMLEQCDPRAQEYAAALDGGWLGEDPEGVLKRAAEEIREYNFDRALELVRQYMGK